MKKKLTLFIYSLGGGGAERATINLARGLVKFYDIQIVIMSEITAYQCEFKIEYLTNDNLNANAINKILSLPSLAKKFAKICANSDIVLASLSRPIIITALAKSYGLNAKVYAVEHTTPSKYYPNEGIANKLMLAALKWAYSKMNAVFAVSNGAANDLRLYFNVRNAIVFPNPLDLEDIKEQALIESPIKPRGFKIVSVGRLVPTKNQALLIRALDKCAIEDAKLILIGDGSERARLESLTEELGLEGRVIFAGFDQNPYRWMANADIFAYSSNLESLPTVLIEALALNIPVVSTDCPNGPREILGGATQKAFDKFGIERTRYGMLVKMNDETALSNAFRILHENEELRQMLVANAAERAKEYDMSSVALKYYSLLES